MGVSVIGLFILSLFVAITSRSKNKSINKIPLKEKKKTILKDGNGVVYII